MTFPLPSKARILKAGQRYPRWRFIVLARRHLGATALYPDDEGWEAVAITNTHAEAARETRGHERRLRRRFPDVEFVLVANPVFRGNALGGNF